MATTLTEEDKKKIVTLEGLEQFKEELDKLVPEVKVADGTDIDDIFN